MVDLLPHTLQNLLPAILINRSALRNKLLINLCTLFRLNLGTRLGEWPTSRPGRFTSEQTVPVTNLNRRLGGPRSRSGRNGEEINLLTLLGTEPRSLGRPPRRPYSPHRLRYPSRLHSRLKSPSVLYEAKLKMPWTLFSSTAAQERRHVSLTSELYGAEMKTFAGRWSVSCTGHLTPGAC